MRLLEQVSQVIVGDNRAQGVPCGKVVAGIVEVLGVVIIIQASEVRTMVSLPPGPGCGIAGDEGVVLPNRGFIPTQEFS
ncbi:hypothetical protein ES703_87824 [subsurface metagenome]